MQKMTSWVSNFFLIRIAILQMITVFVMTTSLWTTHTEAKSFRLWQLFLIKQVWNNYHLFCFLCVEKWKYVFFFLRNASQSQIWKEFVILKQKHVEENNCTMRNLHNFRWYMHEQPWVYTLHYQSTK